MSAAHTWQVSDPHLGRQPCELGNHAFEAGAKLSGPQAIRKEQICYLPRTRELFAPNTWAIILEQLGVSVYGLCLANRVCVGQTPRENYRTLRSP